MTMPHAAASMPGIQASPSGTIGRAGANSALAVAAALFLAVLIVEAVIVITGAPSAADLSSLYLSAT